MTSTYSLQKVNERLIDLTWTLYGLSQVVEHLKNSSYGLSRKYIVYDQGINLMVCLLY